MDWQLTCRVCLETGDMVSLFDWDENNEQLGDKFTYCCGIEVTKNDSLPTLICLNCVDRLTFSYQFKQQCLSSNETLKECLEEFEKSSQQVSTSASSSKPTETETITIKQENGLLLQYELPVEHDPATQWSLEKSNPVGSVVTKAPGAKKRGRPRKYPNERGQIDISPYHRKKPKSVRKEEESLTSLLESGSLDLKQEPAATEDDEPFGGDFPDDDPDFDPVDDNEVEEKKVTPKKRGRPRKPKTDSSSKVKDKSDDNGEDVLLQEAIMAFSEPIPEHILNPKPKKKYPSKKRYNYEKTHTCETCGASFTSNASLQAHIRRHLGIKPFVCSVCGYSCVMNEELKRHMLRHTGERPYKCRICERRFGDYGTRQKHESVCGHACAAQPELVRHMRRHTGAKPFPCRNAECGRVFRDPSSRLKHESVCGHACSARGELVRHMRRHTGAKPYTCRVDECDRVFRDPSSRLQHESVCGHSCVTRVSLIRHMRRHTGAKPYKCHMCDRDFRDSSSRRKHESVCSKSFATQKELVRHVRRHTDAKPFKCRHPPCDKTFNDPSTRFKHEWLHMGLRPYQCTLCSKSFTYSYVLSNHMLTHTGEKKYSCVPCNKKFTKAHHLKYHNKVHHKEVYLQQQIEAEAKKLRQQINVTGLTGVLTGQIVDGTLQLVHGSEDGEQETQMQVVEMEEADTEEKETHRAVASMQEVVLDSEFSIDEDDKGN